MYSIKNFLLKRKLNIICTVCSIITLCLVWVIAYYSVGNDYIIPSFTDTLISLGQCLADGVFWLALLNTLVRTLIAFAVSFALATVLAALSAISKAFCAFVKPVMVFLRTLPTLAVILILLVWTNPKIAPVIVTVLILFPMIYAQLAAAIGGIDSGLVEMAEVYGLSKRDRLFKIYLPLVSPNILSQTGATASFAIKLMVSAEVLANTFNSLGGLMQNAKLYAEMPRLAALTLVAVVLGLIIDGCFSLLERVTFKWNVKEGGN